MKRNRLAIILCVTAAVALASTAIAKPKDRPGGKGLNPARIDRMAEKLNIDKAIVTKIKDVVYAAQAKEIDKRATLQKARLNLQRLMDSDEPDRKAIMSALEAVGRLETDMRKHHIGMLLDVSAMLTSDQRRGFKRLMRQRGKRNRRGMRGHRRGPHGPQGR